MAGMNQWTVSHDAMPSNVKTGNDLLASIEAELVRLLQVPENWGLSIRGIVDSQNKSLVNKVTNVSEMTRRAFHASQEVNAFGNQLLEQGLTEQLDEGKKTTEATTDNPVTWLAR